MGWLLKALGNLIWLIANFALFGFAESLDIFPNGIIAFLTVLALNFPAILIHELGHAWIARRRGAHILDVVALPIGFSTADRRVRLVRHVPSKDIGGYVSYVFRQRDETRQDRIAIAAAGPLANLLSAALMIVLLTGWQVTRNSDTSAGSPTEIVEGELTEAEDFRFPSDTDFRAILEQDREARKSNANRELVEGLAQLFAFISIILGVANLVPYKGSDGSVILRNLRAARRRA